MNAMKNSAASVRARLLNRARADKVDFNLMLTRYALERLLYRLSVRRLRPVSRLADPAPSAGRRLYRSPDIRTWPPGAQYKERRLHYCSEE